MQIASVQWSRFALGTIAWGTRVNGGVLDRLYDTFRAAGGNVFDTAHVYAFWLPDGTGASERALGEIVHRRGDRANVILATKGGHHPVIPGYPRPDAYLSPQRLAHDVQESLERLGVDVIDLYFLHRDDPRVPVKEIVDALDDLVRKKQLRAVAASNWTTRRVEEANGYARRTGKCQFVASQVKFSLARANPSADPTVPDFDEIEHAWHRSTKLPVYAYSPTAGGFFATAGKKGATGWTNPTTLARRAAAESIARDLGVSANQVALAWLLHQPFPVIPILGTENIEHLSDALAAAGIQLTTDQINRLSVMAT